MAKQYYIDGRDEPVTVADENEKEFLENYGALNPKEKKDDEESGNQPSSTEDATVEQNTTASEDSESQYQSEEVKSLSVSPAEKREIEKQKALNYFLKQNELLNEDGSQMTANDILSLDSVDTTAIDNDITAASNAVNEEQIKIDSANSQEQFYDNLYYNDYHAEEDQKDSDARWERDQKKKQEHIDKANKFMPAKDKIYLPQPTAPSVIKEIDSDVKQVYNNTIQDTALNDYIKAKQNPDGGDPNWKYDDKNKEEILNSNSFQKILKNTEKEAKYYREERAKLKRQLKECLGDDNANYCNDKYNKRIEALNKKDRFHGDFSNNLKERNKQLSLENNIEAVIQNKKLRNRDQKELAKDAEVYKDKKKQEIEDKLEHIETVSESFQSVYDKHTANVNWLDNEGKDIKKQIEELRAKEITGDESLLKKIKHIQSVTYTNQEDYDAANKELKQLHNLYKQSIDNEVNERKSQIKNLASTYLNKHTELKDLQATWGDYEKLNDKLYKDLDGLIGDEEKLAMYLKEAKQHSHAISLRGGIKLFADMGINISKATDSLYDLKENTDSFAIKAALTLPIAALDKMTFGGASIIHRSKDGEDSLYDKFIGNVESWKYDKIDSRIQEKPSWESLTKEDGSINWMNAGEFMLTSLFEQAPVLATLYATGGMSAGAGVLARASGLGILSAAAMGDKYDQSKKSRDLYNRTGGLYGTSESYETAFLNSLISGAAEGGFEYITGGIAGRTLQSFARTGLKGVSKEAATLGYKNFVRKRVLNPKVFMMTGGEATEEMIAEGLTQGASNFADKYISGKDISIWQGMDQALITGGVLGGMMTSPRLLADATAAFRSTDANQQMGKIGNKIKDMSAELQELKRKGDPADLNKINRLEQDIVGLVNKSNDILKGEIKKVNLLYDYEKKALVNIETRNLEDRKEAEKIAKDPKLGKKERARKIDELNSKVRSREIRRDKILSRIEPLVAEENYKRDMDSINRLKRKAYEMGSVKINARERDGKGFENDYLKGVEKESGKDSERYRIAASMNAKGGFGFMRPHYRNGNIVAMDAVINKESALEKGELSTGSHELVHMVIANTLKGDPILRERMGKAIDEVVARKGTVVTGMGKKRWAGKLAAYQKGKGREKLGEEKLAVFTELFVDGDIQMSDNVLTRLGGHIRRFTRETMGYPIRFNKPSDIANFVRDVKYYRDIRKTPDSFIRTLELGANGKMFRDNRTEEQAKDEAMFSQAVDLGRRNNLDLKREHDQFVQNSDGARKYRNHEEFENSPDFYNAYLNIVEGRSLDGLIQQGMTEKGLPGTALREFTRLVKEEIGDRFIGKIDKKTGKKKRGFDYDRDPSKTPSLFGWLTGVAGGGGVSVIYRAKGDVMDKYKKEKNITGPSLDKPIGEQGVIADVVSADIDAQLQQLDEMDMSLGRKKIAKNSIRSVKAKDLLEFSEDSKAAIMENIEEVNLRFDDLTYKSFKKLLIDVNKKATSEKKVIPEGSLFGVLNATASEFGVDPLRILANQDLNGEQRKSAQNYIFEKSTNTDGSFNTSLLDILPEGETRSGEATGVANTKLGDLYITGDRVKVSDGATKGLGQKKSQTKRKNVSREEFLSMFGINTDGTTLPGTKYDGAIRAMVVQVAQTIANQQARQHAIINGSASDATMASVADGVGEVMWSGAYNFKIPRQEKIQHQETLTFSIDEVLHKLEGAVEDANGFDITTVKNVVDEIYLDANGKSILPNGVKERIAIWITDHSLNFIENRRIRGNKYKKNYIDYLTDKYKQDTDFNQDLNVIRTMNEYLEKDGDERRVTNTASQTFGDKVSGSAMRADTGLYVKNQINSAIDGTRPGEDVAREIVSIIKNTHAGSGKYGNGDLSPVKLGSYPVEYNGEDAGTPRSKDYVSPDDLLAMAKNNGMKIESAKGPGNYTYKLKNKYGNYKGVKAVPFNASLRPEKIKNILKDKADDGHILAQGYLVRRLEQSFEQMRNGKITPNEFSAIISTIGSGMDSAGRKAAPHTASQENIQKILDYNKKHLAKLRKILGNNKLKEGRLEHGVSLAEYKKDMIRSLFENNGKIDRAIFKRLETHIIGGLLDLALDRAGYQTASPATGRRVTDPDTMREFFKIISDAYSVLGEGVLINLSPMKSLTGDKAFEEKSKIEMEIARQYVKLKSVEKAKLDVVKNAHHLKTDMTPMFSQAYNEPKGMSVFDFDETLIIDGDNFIIATNPETGAEQRISSADWPIRGPELMELGFDFNFDDFINVRGGVTGPLFQKLLNRIKKYGPNNNFILTARPQESAVAIHGWLKSKGVNIPIENITGLANSTGDAKAQWILEKYKEGYNDVYFVDDALPNVQAVKHVMEQLDIKGSSVQAGLKKFGRWILNTNTEEGKRIEREIDNIPTVSSSEFKRVGNLRIDMNTKEGRKFWEELNKPSTRSSGVAKEVREWEKRNKMDEGEMFSRAYDIEFNEMLERQSDIKADRVITDAESRKSRASENMFQKFFVPPSAEDFKGLLYKFLGKGEQGNKDLAFFKRALLDPFAKAIREYNTYRQSMAMDYSAIQKKFPNVVKSFNDKIPGSVFNNEDAIRMYLWNKAGHQLPGLSQGQVELLADHIARNTELLAFAEALSDITKTKDGYVEPDENWAATSIASDLNTLSRDKGRKEFLADWIESKNIIFSKDNLNKVQAIHGKPTRDALEAILYRMETGTNRPQGHGMVTNKFLNWINGSVGAVMFFNMRSALLQTISTVNFINWQDNNMFAAARAFANQPQYWKDFAMIFNSPMLKQRRAGIQIDVNYNELTDAFKNGRSKPEAVIRYLLEKGFIPTKAADSFAIAAGGATFFRNRYNTYVKEGATPEQAQEQAFLDFQEIAEETQQSSRPDLISEQQAGILGRLILAWQNTPMQMTRLTKKALSDLVNGRGDWKSNVSRIMYYGLVQNIIFGTLQTGLAFIMFGNDEEEKKKKAQRVANGALDTLLRGTGVWGAAVSTLKNTIMKFHEERKKGWRGDHAYTLIEAINLSPPVGSKFRKVYSAIQTDRFNRGVSEKLKYRIENPSLSIAGNVVEALTNLPMARVINKANNLEEAITGNHELWQRVAIAGGWNYWTVGVEDEELQEAKQEVKDEKAEKKKIEKENKKLEDKKKKEEEKKAEDEKKKKEGIKEVRCSAVKSNGQRCKMMVETKGDSATCMYHKTYTDKEEKEGTDRDNDGIKEFRCTATKKNGQRCKNRTENKNKKCYAHQ